MSENGGITIMIPFFEGLDFYWYIFQDIRICRSHEKFQKIRNLLGMPETSFKGLKTRTARSVRRSIVPPPSLLAGVNGIIVTALNI